MIRIVVAVDDKKYGEDFMVALLPQGLEVYIVDHKEVLLKIIAERTPHVIIFDSDSDVFGGLDGLTELQADEALDGVQTILFSKESGLDFVKKTMAMGVVGYLYKPIVANEIKSKIDGILHGLHAEKNRREFVRVKPAEKEKSRVEVLFFDGSGVSGMIRDISLGGIAFTLNNPTMISRINAGTRYETVRLMLDGRPGIELSAEAVLARGDMAAFKFTGFDNSSLKVLCRYIHDRLLSIENGEGRQEHLMESV